MPQPKDGVHPFTIIHPGGTGKWGRGLGQLAVECSNGLNAHCRKIISNDETCFMKHQAGFPADGTDTCGFEIPTIYGEVDFARDDMAPVLNSIKSTGCGVQQTWL